MASSVRCVAGIKWTYLPVVIRNCAKLKDFVDHVMPSVRPGWRREEVVVRNVNTGLGLTNSLIGFYNKRSKDPEEDLILLRVNGPNTELFIDRKREIYMRGLFSSVNLGPPVYCEFENGLCYRYIPGKPLEHKNLSDPFILQNIAASFALFHTYKLPEQLAMDQVTPVTLLNSLFPILTNALYNLPRFKEVFVSKDSILDEFSDIKKLLRGFSSPVVLCHNDLQPGNVIVSKDNLSFIDLEYAGPNYTACEIGNFFCEYAGLDPDYTRCPNMEEQKRFIKMYLQEVSLLKGTPEASDEDVDKFCTEVNQGAVVMHFLWIVWSLGMSVLHNEPSTYGQTTTTATPPPDQSTTPTFNYLEYAILRYKQYWKMKDEFCSHLN